MSNIVKMKSSNNKDKNRDKDNFSIINSRVRVIRNISGFQFVSHLDLKDKKEIEDIVINLFNNSATFDFFVLNSDNLLDKEKNFYTKNFFLDKDIFLDSTRFIFFKKLNIVIFFNNKDHIRIIGVANGLSLASLFKNIFKIENFLSNNLEFSASIRYGYLTPIIKNCGLGLKFSLLLHLPGIVLNKKRDLIFSDLLYRGYKVTPFIDNSFYFVVSSNINLGVSEEKLLERFEEGVKILLDIEKKELMEFYNKYKENSDDIIFRSYGLLKYIKKISYDEALNNISNILIGLSVGNLYFKKKVNIPNILNNITDYKIGELSSSNNNEESIIRANIIRNFINSIGEKSNV